MAQSAILGFGVSLQFQGLGGGVDRKWVAVGGGKKEDVGQRKGFNKAIRVSIHRGPPALRCAPNQKPLQSWPRVQKPPEEEGEQVEEEGKGQGDTQPNYKPPLADPPPGYFPQQTGGGGYPYPPYPYPNVGYPPHQQFYPNVGYPPHQQFYPNVGYPPQEPYSNVGYPPQQFYPNVGYPLQHFYPNVGYPPQQPYPNVGYPPQQFYPQQPYPRQQQNPPPLSTIADLASLLANAQEILNSF